MFSSLMGLGICLVTLFANICPLSVSGSRNGNEQEWQSSACCCQPLEMKSACRWVRRQVWNKFHVLEEWWYRCGWAGACQPLRSRSACPYQPDLGVNTVILRGVAPPSWLGLFASSFTRVWSWQDNGISPPPSLYKMLSVGRLIWLSALCVLLLLLRLNMDARLLVHLICLWTLEPSLALYLSRYKGFGAVTPWPIFVNSIRWVFGGCFWY